MPAIPIPGWRARRTAMRRRARTRTGTLSAPRGDYVEYMPFDEGWTPETSERVAEQAIDPDMVEQGGVGDCGLMASLMALAQSDPDLIRDNLVRNDDGTWTVTLYKDGLAVPITVDSTMPAEGGHSLVPADLDGDGVEEYHARFSWVTIYEKAMAEFTSEYGAPSYEELNNGGYGDEYLTILTGNEAQRTDESSFADLSARLQEGPVTAATEQPREWWRFTGEVDDPTIVPNHEYNVHGFIPAGTPAPDGTVSDEDRIHLDNPWGPDENDSGGQLGDLYLTEQEYRDNFRAASSVATR
ncbi:C2 family cysteine protease [Brachybacterium sp. DNPG3]